ncbi:hypothetical protein HDR59_02635 [bacterium]|nr:hypothetical protein [bacterium]
MDNNDLSLILLITTMVVSMPIITLVNKEAGKNNFPGNNSNSLPLSTGTVVEKVETNSETLFLIDTDGNKDTIEKMMKVEDNTYDIQKGSQIKFKDKYPEKSELNISQVVFDNLVSNQK